MPVSTPQGRVLEERRTSPGLLLAMVGRVTMRRLRETHAAHGLSPRQFHLLALLHDDGPRAQAELGSVTETDPSILVTMLNPLEEAGLISRERDPEDRRRHVVTLTPRGEAHLSRAARAQREAEDELLVGLSRPERAELARMLIALQATMPTVGGGEECAPDALACPATLEPATDRRRG